MPVGNWVTESRSVILSPSWPSMNLPTSSVSWLATRTVRSSTKAEPVALPDSKRKNDAICRLRRSIIATEAALPSGTTAVSPRMLIPVAVTALDAPSAISCHSSGSPTRKSRTALASECTTIPICGSATVPSRNSSSSTSSETAALPVLPSESVAVSVIVWTPVDGRVRSSDAPVPRAPSIELDQARAAAASGPSCGSVALPASCRGEPSVRDESGRRRRDDGDRGCWARWVSPRYIRPGRRGR